jgi:agmatine deiminase
MPAEWEPHVATWFTWPRPEGISFPDKYDAVPPVYAELIRHLVPGEEVKINVWNAEMEDRVREVLTQSKTPVDRVRFHHFPAYEPWCRDHGPIFLTRNEDPRLAVVDWDYNAWGGKYPPCDLDAVVPTRVAEKLGLPVYYPHMILEGGSIEVNGAGALLTTEACLLNPNRNPQLSRGQIEQRLRDYLGVREILWLGDGIEGDDTDGHIDDLTRFVSERAVVTVTEEDESDANHAPLHANLERLRGLTIDGKPLEISTLPMPGRIEREGLRLPASYANFYIANQSILLPTFADPKDEEALTVLQRAFPTRRIIPIDCRELIWGLGAFHCLTQQQPAL